MSDNQETEGDYDNIVIPDVCEESPEAARKSLSTSTPLGTAALEHSNTETVPSQLIKCSV